VIYKRISCTCALGKCLNVHISFAFLSLSHVYRESNENLVGILSCILFRHFLPGGKERIICPTILGETADLGGRVDGAVFPLLSMEREAPFAKHLIIMDVSFLLFLHLFTFMTLDLPSMKYKELWYLKWILFFWVANTYFPISHVSSPYFVFLPTPGGETAKKTRI
jgi:hypothetical protein